MMNTMRRLMFWVVAGALMLILFAQVVCAQPPAGKQEEKKAPAPCEETKKAAKEGEKKDKPAPEGEQAVVRRSDTGMMQERMVTRLKETLACTDEEWKTIEPAAKSLVDVRMKGSMMSGGSRRPREGGPAPAGPAEMEDLKKALDSEKSTPDEIKQKLAAFRDMRKKNEEELKKSQENLRKVVNIKQEARLVLMGYLE